MTIEAGAAVNLGSCYIMVNSTLNARGTAAGKIQFNGGQLIFTQFSANWCQSTGLGSVLENANLSTTSITINTAGPKIVSNTLSTVSSIMGGSTLITNNTCGILSASKIQNNTITNNFVGVAAGGATLTYNNIYGNTISLNNTSSGDWNATYNWWGTMDIAEINQTICDYKNDFTLGRVNFVPMLTAPNPNAPSVNTPIPPVIPEFQTPIIMMAILLITKLSITVGLLTKRKR